MRDYEVLVRKPSAKKRAYLDPWTEGAPRTPAYGVSKRKASRAQREGTTIRGGDVAPPKLYH